MKVYAVIVTYYDSLWSDPCGICVDSAFSTKEGAEKRAAKLKVKHGEDCSARVREITLDVEDAENSIRIC